MNAPPILDNVRLTPSAVESLLVERLQEHEEKMEEGSLPASLQ